MAALEEVQVHERTRRVVRFEGRGRKMRRKGRKEKEEGKSG
jgi:hypothetical protein